MAIRVCLHKRYKGGHHTDIFTGREDAYLDLIHSLEQKRSVITTMTGPISNEVNQGKGGNRIHRLPADANWAGESARLNDRMHCSIFISVCAIEMTPEKIGSFEA